MTKGKKAIFWVGVISGLPGLVYFFTMATFYAWLNAAEPERWPSEKSAILAGGSLLLAIVFAFYFGYATFSLISESNRKYREKMEQSSQAQPSAAGSPKARAGVRNVMNRLTVLLLVVLLTTSIVPADALGGRVPTKYPQEAIENCIEGFVHVQYTFSSEGQPQDIKVLDASPPGVFEDATQENLSYWRNPQRAGETEVQTIEYRIDDAESCDS